QQLKIVNLKTQIAERRGQMENITSPVRKRLLQEAENDASRREADLPQPIGRWAFDESANDLVAAADSELRSGAHIKNGTLIVSGGGHVVTQPLQHTLKAKTLEAWVQLDNLNQRGGGVMTIQTPNGVMFDSIVFGERDPKQWMAGSNGFARTQPFNGPQEQEATEQPVHVAIAYHPDGRIVGYRNGLPYGQSYKSNGPFEFKAGEAVVSFGIRHLPAGGNRMLAGRIIRAQIYDCALSAEEIAATSGVAPAFIPENRVLSALSSDDRAAVQGLSLSAKTLEAELRTLGPVPQTVNDAVLWSELAQALFTFKEFIYVR
ncbi:MAG: LamG-like jellyroll fold domain-containing protein, partial [Fuerstiella sp.]